jgi:ADP-ribose pyrophosphatase
MEDHLKWKELKKKSLRNCRIFTLNLSRRISLYGKKNNFYVLNAPDWVTVIPLIKNEEGIECFLMVKQYRHGIEKVMYEFPAGIVEKNETHKGAARRELFEETGYHAGKLTFIGKTYPCPSFMTNQSHTFLAVELEARNDRQLDSDELIEPFIIPIKEVASNIHKRIKTFINAQTIVSFGWYERYMSMKKK